MVIEPQLTIPLVYQLSDPADASTYYIRAVVRNSLTGDIIATVNLASQGAGRYTNSFLSPKDPTGLGFHIDITITVYTDAAYTTASDVYQRTMTNYLVRKAQQSWGGGGADVDYDKIEKLVRKVVAEIEKEEPAEMVDLSPLMDEIRGVRQCVDEMEMPEMPEMPKPVDLTPVLERIDRRASETKEAISKDMKTQIAGINIPEPVDLEPLLASVEKLSGLGDAFEKASTRAVSALEQITNQSQAFFKQILAEIQNRGAKMKELMRAAVEGSDMPAPAPEKREKHPLFDKLFRPLP